MSETSQQLLTTTALPGVSRSKPVKSAWGVVQLCESISERLIIPCSAENAQFVSGTCQRTAVAAGIIDRNKSTVSNRWSARQPLRVRCTRNTRFDKMARMVAAAAPIQILALLSIGLIPDPAPSPVNGTSANVRATPRHGGSGRGGSHSFALVAAGGGVLHIAAVKSKRSACFNNNRPGSATG